MRSESRRDEANAIVMRACGPPEVLRLERVPLAPLAPDEIRLRSRVSAVNHSDLAVRSGHHRIFRTDPFPYVPGLETVGEVVACGEQVADFQIGDRVITMMQGLGGVRAKRPGGYAEFVTVSAAAAALVPADLDPLELAALGLASVTALEGLRKLGPLEGRRIAVTGATGGVGSAAVSIAHVLGARVIALISRAERADYARALGAAETILASEVARGALGEETLGGVLDAIGGSTFGALVAALRPGAALSLVGAMAGDAVNFDAYRLLEVTLTGYSSEQLDGLALRRAMATLVDWLRRGVQGRLLLVP